jgi:APA family basic amino acid/polyamine antiporter
MVWLAFLLCSLIAAFTGLSYAELSSMYPKEGGEYVYTLRAFGKKLAFLVGWLLIFGGVIAASTVALGFGGYFSALFGTPILLAAIALIVLMSVINHSGIKKSSWTNIILTTFDILGVVIIILLGLKYFGRVNYFELPAAGFSGVLSATALIFFAYLGFEDIVRLSEETKDARHNVPKALIISILITSLLYVLVSISAVSVLGWEKLSASKAPLADVAATAFGTHAFWLIALFGLFATASTVLVTLIATSRLIYGMAEVKALPNKFLKLDRGTATPTLAIFLVCLASVLFVLMRDIKLVASLTDFALFIAFALVNLSVIFLRYKEPKTVRHFRSPVNLGRFPVLAALGAGASLFMLTQFDLEVWGIGLGALVVGLIAYLLLNRKLNH